MNVTNLLIWIIPTVFLVFFLYRLSFVSASNRLKQRNKLNLLLFACVSLIIIAIGMYFFYYRVSCPTEISPQEFAKMITQNEDYRAEIFYKHKFRASQRTGSIIDTASIDTYIKYLYETGPRDKNGDIIDVTERVTTTTLCTQCVDYAVKESSKFYKFFEYIEFLGAKRMTIVDTTGDYEHYVYNGKEYYEYNNCVFVKVGFDRRTQEFIISMLGSKIFNYKYTLAK